MAINGVSYKGADQKYIQALEKKIAELELAIKVALGKK